MHLDAGDRIVQPNAGRADREVLALVAPVADVMKIIVAE